MCVIIIQFNKNQYHYFIFTDLRQNHTIYHSQSKFFPYPGLPTQPSDFFHTKIFAQNSKITDRNFYYCDCGRKYSHERHLKYHLKYECGKKLKCCTCAKSFKDIQYYRLHVERCANKRSFLGDPPTTYDNQIMPGRI